MSTLIPACESDGIPVSWVQVHARLLFVTWEPSAIDDASFFYEMLKRSLPDHAQMWGSVQVCPTG